MSLQMVCRLPKKAGACNSPKASEKTYVYKVYLSSFLYTMTFALYI